MSSVIFWILEHNLSSFHIMTNAVLLFLYFLYIRLLYNIKLLGCLYFYITVDKFLTSLIKSALDEVNKEANKAETICFSQLEFWLEKLKSTLFFFRLSIWKTKQYILEFKPNDSDWRSRYRIRNLQEFWWRCTKILMLD